MRRIKLAAVVVVLTAGATLAQIGEPVLIGQGSDPAWSPDESRIAFLQGHGDGDWLMVKDVGSGLEAEHLYTAPILRFAWLDDSTLVTQERSMPAIEGGRLKISRIVKVFLNHPAETIDFDSVDVTKQNDRNLNMKIFSDGSIGYYDDSISTNEPQMLSHRMASDSTTEPSLFLATVPRSWGKVWLYYGSTDRGRRVTLTENHYILPRLSPDQSKFFCHGSRGTVVFDTSGNELALFGQVDYAQWSPDGQYIAFCRTEFSEFDIEASDLWIAKYDGSEMRQLTDTPDVIETGGVFSPTGRFLAYTNDRARKIYVIKLN